MVILGYTLEELSGSFSNWGNKERQEGVTSSFNLALLLGNHLKPQILVKKAQHSQLGYKAQHGI